MPAWSLGEIVSTATQALGNRSDIALSTASLWANESQREVWDVTPHDLQEAIAVSSTTVNEDKITLPSDYQELLVLSNLSVSIGGKPVLLDEINLDDLESWSATTGEPTHYALYSDWLELRPVPDSAYSLQLRYRKQLSDMTELTDVPSVATRFRYAVFLKTKELLAQHAINAPELAIQARNDYLSFMASNPSDRALRQRENHFFGLGIPRGRGETPGGTAAYDFDTSDT